MTSRPARNARRFPGLETLESRQLLATGLGPTSVVAATVVPPVLTSSRLANFFVQFKSTASAKQSDAAIRAVGGTVEQTYPDGSKLVEVGSPTRVAAAIKRLDANPLVQYVQTNAVIHSRAAFYPNDPAFPYSWGLNNVNDVDMNAPEAWGITIGSSATVVAVLDSGIDFRNPDFANRIWTNPSPSATGGTPFDIHGWNFVANTNNVQDDNGHGTFVTSLIAAAGNNATGVSGLAWNVQIMPLKFLDANGIGTTDRAVAAIYYAVNHGAKVINASWGGIDYTQPLADAVAYANSRNVVLVTAAGNEGVNNDVIPSYPANLRAPNELSVTAIDSNGQFPSFSNYGSRTVDIAAPGVSIVGAYPTAFSASGLQVLSGTSMATAYVSGVVALLAGVHPELTAAQLVQRINATAKPLPSLVGRVISGGMVDAFRALGSTAADVQTTILGSDEYHARHGGTARGFVTGLYQDLLNRSPDPGGLSAWAGLYESGGASRSAIAAAILATPEARATQVAGLYQTELGRAGSIAALKTDPGVLGWARGLGAGLSLATVESLILASPEYLLAHGASPPTVAAAWYQDLMGRTADPAGLTTLANFLWAGTAPVSVVQALQNTAEAKATRVARWFSRYLGRSTPLASLKTDPGVASFAANLLPS